jgi:hypothetical protein
MTHARHTRRRSAALALAALGAALALLPSTAAAQPSPPGAWYGWGTKFVVENGAPKVTFVAYVAQDGTPPKVIASQETDITDTCDELGNGTIDYETAAANFDGDSYLACELPSWEEATSELGFDLPDTGECMICATGGAPIWGDFEVTPAGPGDMPIVNASSVGISINVESTGVTARARLDVDRVLGGPVTSYRSPSWTIASAPNAHAVVGIEGDGIVAVADYFNWLDYLDLNWRPWFKSAVEGATAGSWVEKTATAPADRSTQTARQYEMGVDGGPLYIGYDPDTGNIFNGKLGPGGIEPGCKGL